ncbi:MAG TPA: hypothetical protein VK716_02150 [Terracidiphilus sp.]|jgi:hypothetical protein|nr:hypothetical protein [Terracidiphilus sp.]
MTGHATKLHVSARRRLGQMVCCKVALALVCAMAAQRCVAQSDPASAKVGEMAGGGMAHMAHMADHMHMTELRPMQAGDQEKANAIVAAAKEAMAPYKDYRKALADGYHIFLPNIPQPQYHFTKYEYGREAAISFDPLKPTSLLYKKTADGGYELVGAMYTDRVSASEEELNERIPLSVARWHQHVNFCKAPVGQLAAYFGPNAKFGLMGSIHTKDACEAEGGTFIPHVLGWMVHVYPYETDPKKVWSVDDDGDGHDNMDHSAMPGMKMN